MMASAIDGFQFEEYENVFKTYLRREGNWISKRPHDVLELAERVPENPLGKKIYVLVLRRDLRDVLTSIHPRVPGQYFIGYAGCFSGPGPNGEPPTYKNAGVRQIDEAIESLRSRRDIELVFVRYEDLVADPDREQVRLAGRLGVRFKNPFSRFHEDPAKLALRYEGRYAPLDPSRVYENKAADVGRINKWRAEEHRERIRDQFTRHPELFEMLKRHGYEADDTWFGDYCESKQMRLAQGTAT